MDSLTSTATKVPGMRKKVMVDVEQLSSLSDALRTAIPADIQEAREVLRQKESMVIPGQPGGAPHQGRREAGAVRAAGRDRDIVRQAEMKAEKHPPGGPPARAQEITQDAQRRAYKIVEDAETLADHRREGSNQYARETLFDLEERLSTVLGQVRRGIDTLGLKADTKIPLLTDS